MRQLIGPEGEYPNATVEVTNQIMGRPVVKVDMPEMKEIEIEFVCLDAFFDWLEGGED